MSLFSNSDYRWRETCFVLMASSSRPLVEEVRSQLDAQFEIGQFSADDEGRLETLTVFSPNDFSAMEICFVDGDDVTEQMEDLLKELKQSLLEDDFPRLDEIAKCDARLDVLHFERIMDPMDDEDEFLDPGSLLLVLEQLASQCDGIGIDPQSGTII